MIKKRIFFLVLISFFTGNAVAQQVVLSGKIVNKQGQGIPFASIYIKNTSTGTSANAEGEYRLLLKPGAHHLVIRAIAFQQLNERVLLMASQQKDFTLNEEVYQLNDIVIRADAEDPAYAIIRQAIKKRKSHLNAVKGYRAQVYIKGMQKLLAAPKKFMGLNIDEAAKQLGLDSNRRGIIYLSESESRLSFQSPGQYREEMIASKVSGSNRAFSFNRASDLQVNFYENFQNWGSLSNRPLVSPIAETALLYYDYKFLGNMVENGEMVNKIQVIAKRKSDPVFEGNIYIMEDSWRIHSADLFITKQASLNFVDTLKIKQDFFPVKRTAWMPSNLNLEFNGAFLGFRFAGYYLTVFKDYELDPDFSKTEFRESLKITREVNKKDSSYWEMSRPIPLTAEEMQDYKKKEALAAKRESKSYLDSLDKAGNRFRFSKVLLGNYTIRNRYERKTWQINSLLNSVFYNTVEGLGLNLNAGYIRRIDTATNRVLSLSGNLRYGFSNKHFNAGAAGTFPIGKYNLSVKLGSDVLDLNSRGAISSSVNTIGTLFYERNNLKLYEKQYLSAAVSGRWGPNIRTRINLEYANRKSLPNTTFYTFRDLKNREFTSNNPFSPLAELPLFPENQSLKIAISLNYNFSSRYVTYPSGKYYTSSKYPDLNLTYQKAVRGFMGSDPAYDFISAGLSKSAISMGLYGRSSFGISMGKFFNRQNLYYPDYHHFGSLPAFSDQDNFNNFLFTSYYLSSTADKFLELHLEHNFSGFILNKIPVLRKLKMQELLGYNYLSTTATPRYQEWYTGLKFLNLQVLYGWSFSAAVQQEQGLRLIFELR